MAEKLTILSPAMTKNSPESLSHRGECRACARNLILQAHQSIAILSQQLEVDLYHDRDIYDHISKLAANNRKANIRIIAQDTRTAPRQGHFLIHLAQQFPSFVQIRTTANRAHRQFRESWLIVDERAYMCIRNPQHYQGYFETSNRLECRTYIQYFEEIWQASQPDQNTRRLSL